MFLLLYSIGKEQHHQIGAKLNTPEWLNLGVQNLRLGWACHRNGYSFGSNEMEPRPLLSPGLRSKWDLAKPKGLRPIVNQIEQAQG